MKYNNQLKVMLKSRGRVNRRNRIQNLSNESKRRKKRRIRKPNPRSKKGNMINLTLSLSRNTLHTNEYMYSCLENPRDRGAWRAAIYGVTQARTWLKWLSSSSSNIQITSNLLENREKSKPPNIFYKNLTKTSQEKWHKPASHISIDTKLLNILLQIKYSNI